MSGRALLVLALLAVAAVGGVVLTRESPVDERPRARTGERLLPGLEDRINDVTGLRVRGAGGALVARVARSDGAWRVTNRAGYPADEATLRGTLIRLARAERLERKTDRPAAYPRLGVADIEQASGKAIEVSLEGLERELAVLVGKPSTGDVGGTYVRVSGQRRAWLVSGEIERSHRVADWLDDRLVDIPAAQVRSVRIEAVDGEPVVVRHPAPRSDEYTLNVPEGRRPLSNSIARSLARVVADLRLEDVVPVADAPDLPRLAVARFETFDGLVVEIETLAASREGAAEGARHARLRASTTAAADASAAARAEALDERFGGWVYRLPEYKFVNASQRLEGVLEEPR